MTTLSRGATSADAESYSRALLQGERVRLRAVQQRDLEELVAAWESPTVAIHQTTTWVPRPDEDVADLLRGWTKNGELRRGVSFAVESPAGELIGWVALFGATYPHRSAELGITLNADRMGQGLGQEVLALILRYGFQELGLHRIHLEVFAYNSRGITAYERAGFVREGVHREAMYRGGSFHDVVLMSILEDEWRSGAGR